MGFVERIFHPVVSAVERAFTPPGTGGQEAAAQQQVAAQQAAKMPAAPQAPAAPPAPPQFQAGATPAQKRAQIAGTSILGAAAAGGEVAKASASGGGQRKSVLG